VTTSWDSYGCVGACGMIDSESRPGKKTGLDNKELLLRGLPARLVSDLTCS
jgi:hypothetical protein